MIFGCSTCKILLESVENLILIVQNFHSIQNLFENQVTDSRKEAFVSIILTEIFYFRGAPRGAPVGRGAPRGVAGRGAPPTGRGRAALPPPAPVASSIETAGYDDYGVGVSL